MGAHARAGPRDDAQREFRTCEFPITSTLTSSRRLRPGRGAGRCSKLKKHDPSKNSSPARNSSHVHVSLTNLIARVVTRADYVLSGIFRFFSNNLRTKITDKIS